MVVGEGIDFVETSIKSDINTVKSKNNTKTAKDSNNIKSVDKSFLGSNQQASFVKRDDRH